VTYILPGISPARLRIEAAGRAFQEAKAREAARKKEEAARRVAEAAARAAEVFAAAQAKDPPVLWPTTTARAIICSTCLLFDITEAELKGGGRARGLIEARFHAVMRLRTELGLSTPSIGRLLNRDHTSIINLLRKSDGVDGAYRSGSWKRRKNRSPEDVRLMTVAERQRAMEMAR